MKPEKKSNKLLGVTRSKAKMYEYGVEEEHHINIAKDPASLFSLTVGLLGEYAANLNFENPNEDYLMELSKNLQFSAHFFDAYLETRLSTDMDNYLLLLGSASYYLCDLPGSSKVLANRINIEMLDLDCSNLDNFLIWLLNGDFTIDLKVTGGTYREIKEIANLIKKFFKSGNGEQEIYQVLSFLREKAYQNGNSRELLFADVISSIVKKRIENSSWKCLPNYSNLKREKWESVLKKNDFIQEFWPSQHLLGENDVFKGQSAVVQMPTSAGKTKAIEIIIRSAFLSNRTSLAVIVAPFKALCHEISNTLNRAFQEESIYIDELTDIPQIDFDISSILNDEQIMVVTPEKLLYMLRNFPDLAKSIGLLIYDEGHQFDSGTRGINYELLLTSLKGMVPNSAQKVLISAVISNAKVVGDWLNGEENKLISGTTLSPTYRTVAFTSWLDHFGRLEFVNAENPEERDFYLPRIIKEQQLQLFGRETKERVFPAKNDGNAISLSLGLKLVPNGSVAIFCGTKTSVSSMCQKVIDAYERGLTLKKPVYFSNEIEVKKLHFLYKSHLGSEEFNTRCASIGIFTHHGSIPHGIRVAVEHSMSENLVKFVICTSTLAQGVNLPIKYLIVTSLYQGIERIKVRDFHNLIGRVGRSGMHTEGSIIFSDTLIYDKRAVRKDNWRWLQVKTLLDPDKSEPCGSSLLMIFEPLFSNDKKEQYKINFPKLYKIFLENPNEILIELEKIASEYATYGFTIDDLTRQVKIKIDAVAGIESYLMANWEDTEKEMDDYKISALAKGTFAYFLADDEFKEHIDDLFKLLAKNISDNIPQNSKKRIFGKMLYGVKTALEIEKWAALNLESLKNCKSSDELLYTLWPLLSDNIQNNVFKKSDQPEILREIALGWIKGKSFAELFKILLEKEVKIKSEKREKNFKIEQVVELCENAFSYEGVLLIGAVAELLESSLANQENTTVENIRILQKRVKYGLLDSSSIMFYELGFVDRIISHELSFHYINSGLSKKYNWQGIIAMRENRIEFRKLISKYPSYFTKVFNSIVN
ncbi:DEAD/DEAH box helicase [Bacillus sp. N3536]|nr:DEAD/DEAH box helicase [Bacillus sp. N3536]